MTAKASKKTLKDLVLILIPSFFILFYNLGGGSLASWDEALYATVAKEMFLSHDWLKLSYAGAPWIDKPPLCLWATALFYSVFGVSEFAARAWSASCGVGAVLVTYLLARELFDRWTGLVAALVLLSSMHFIRSARFGMMDAPLTFFLSLSLYLFWKGQNSRRALFASGLAFGLAFLTKSFAAFFVLGVSWIYCLWAGRTRLVKDKMYWSGLLAGLALALPWFFYEFSTYSEAFLHDAFTKHLLHRTSQVIDGHTGNAYFYIRLLVNKYHPWILVGVLSAPFFLYRAVKDRRPEFIFLSTWMFFIFGAVTAVQTKLAWYLVPVYPALSISVAYALAKLFHEKYKVQVYAVLWVILLLHIPYSHIFRQDYARPLKGIASLVKAKVPVDAPVALYNFHEGPAAQFYLERKNVYVDQPELFLEKAMAQASFFCLIHEPVLKSVVSGRSKLPVHTLGCFEGFCLVSNRSS